MEVLGFRKMVFLIMIMMTMMANMAKSELHYVGGGKSTWAPNVNFTEWSSHEHFHVKDWLCKLSSLILFYFYFTFFFMKKKSEIVKMGIQITP